MTDPPGTVNNWSDDLDRPAAGATTETSFPMLLRIPNRFSIVLAMVRPPHGKMYSHVARQMAERIGSGEFRLGERLPSERDLAQSYRISRPTMREAIIALEVDGLIEVRQGSGMYVIADQPRNGRSAFLGAGPFELLEARRAVETEACALAALRASEADLARIAALLAEMEAAGKDFVKAEAVDRRFHEQIARASQNGPLLQSVEQLWEARSASPQQQLLSEKAHVAGVGPRYDEHQAILHSLVSRDQNRARAAMRDHLNRVLDALVMATEVHESETLEIKNQARRQRLLAPE